MSDITVSSWHDLNERLYEGSWNETLSRYRSRFAFRGLGDARSDLTTSLMRLGGHYQDVERHLLRDFRTYAPRDVVPLDSLWIWLALAQHHGLPTRLLDWTFSPYVAMHFATNNTGQFDRDGVIWCVERAPATALLPQRLQKIVEKEGSWIS